MSLVNDLIRRARARPAPSELTINDNQVGTLADHARQSWSHMAPVGELEAHIRKGQMFFMGIRIRVLGGQSK